ncbi:MAG: hypothetical protein HYY22_00395 [Thaumarchaeota archaeon]|nr:hypothetical protein [Nitrososphaerota archaeon]
MIPPQELRMEARRKGLPLDLVEKDYALGWILFGIASSSLSGLCEVVGSCCISIRQTLTSRRVNGTRF